MEHYTVSVSNKLIKVIVIILDFLCAIGTSVAANGAAKKFSLKPIAHFKISKCDIILMVLHENPPNRLSDIY